MPPLPPGGPGFRLGNIHKERSFLPADQQVSKGSVRTQSNLEPLPKSPEIHEKLPLSTIESPKSAEILLPLSDPLVTRLISCCLHALPVNRGPTQCRQLGRFRLWVDEYDTPPGQLENILKESPILREATITLLADLCNILNTRASHGDDTNIRVFILDTLPKERPSVLEEACTIYPGISQLFPDSNSDSGGEEDEIETIVDSLFNLSPLLVDILENPPRDTPTGFGNNEEATAVPVVQKFNSSGYVPLLLISLFIFASCLMLLYPTASHAGQFLTILQGLRRAWFG
ncbi:hypothetical protein L873DRAFT_1794471 [Choiromyces venosus 120613-1]|uniref:Uncharacterized protein n=1 Tax=Choiromyces venosus 120613-1 TaxID=1336337 RepID=A0A3N4J1B9_9PEZI|nr:hypothetical protein L873DRAFT_1794471 [Choiromyces venosus 120613-1]